MKRVSVLFLAIMLCVSCQSSDGLSFRTFSEKCEDSIVSEKANTAELICNLTYPIGKSKINEDIREWLNQAIMQEFAATHENDDSPEIELSIHTDNLQEAFRDYSSQYYKWVKKEYCDEQGGLYPLQHIAILPQGIVVSYHPYQIGAFLEGDYHILIPFKNIGKYLHQDISFIYSDQDTQK